MVLIKLLNRILSRYDLILVNNKWHPSYDRLRWLPPIKTVIDIGVGHQGSPFLYSTFPHSQFISIDPLKEAEHAIPDHINNIFINKALGSSKAVTELQVSCTPSRSSLLNRIGHDDNSKIIEMREITLSLLDEVLRELITHNKMKLEGSVLLKIDTEGYELEVLKGGKDTLLETDYVILEIPLSENFEDQYTFSEMIGFMANSGFEPFQILKAGRLTTDILFVKKTIQ